MSEEIRELTLLIYDMANMHNIQEFKTAVSFFTFLASFMTGIFMLYDNFRSAPNRKLDKSPFRLSINLAALSFFALSVFCFSRTLDGFADMIYLMENPEVATTLSQRSLVLEIPLLGVGIQTFIFLIAYIRQYTKIQPEERYK